MDAIAMCGMLIKKKNSDEKLKKNHVVDQCININTS